MSPVKLTGQTTSARTAPTARRRQQGGQRRGRALEVVSQRGAVSLQLVPVREDNHQTVGEGSGAEAGLEGVDGG